MTKQQEVLEAYRKATASAWETYEEGKAALLKTYEEDCQKLRQKILRGELK